MDNTAATSRDSSGVLRTDGGRYATELKGELAAGLEQYIRTSNRAEELLDTVQAAREHLHETNQASIDAQTAGWGSANSTHYGENFRLSMEYVHAQLDMKRAQWDLDQFRLDQARDAITENSSDAARSIIADMHNGVLVSAEMKAQAMVAAETDEQIAIDYLATWPGRQSLLSSQNHPGRHIFLGHKSDRVRLIAIREGVAGTSPVQLAEIMSVYPMPEVSAAVRAVLRKNGFPGKAKVDGNGILFGDTYFDRSSAGHRYYLSQRKPNRMPGKIGPIYED